MGCARPSFFPWSVHGSKNLPIVARGEKGMFVSFYGALPDNTYTSFVIHS